MLELQNVSVVYSDKTKAIDAVDLEVNEGESIALIGENGAGKTTLLLTIVGILTPENGTVSIDDLQLDKKSVNEIRKKIGLVFQNPDDQLFMPFIFDDVAFGCRNIGLPDDMIKTRVNETLARLNINHLGSRSSLKLSWGEKRLAAIATVLAMDPSVLMFDEPTAFLDHKARRILIEILKNLHHTKIVATHDLNFVAEVCSRVVILLNGQVAADGTADLLYDRELMRRCGLEAIDRAG